MHTSKSTSTQSDIKRVRHKAHLLGFQFKQALLPDALNINDLYQCYRPDRDALYAKHHQDRGTALPLQTWEARLDTELARVPEGQRPGLKHRTQKRVMQELLAQNDDINETRPSCLP